MSPSPLEELGAVECPHMDSTGPPTHECWNSTCGILACGTMTMHGRMKYMYNMHFTMWSVDLHLTTIEKGTHLSPSPVPQ